MQDIMYELAKTCGFDFVPTNFSELFTFMFLALCGTAVLASIIKYMFFISLNAHKIGR